MKTLQISKFFIEKGILQIVLIFEKKKSHFWNLLNVRNFIQISLKFNFWKAKKMQCLNKSIEQKKKGKFSLLNQISTFANKIPHHKFVQIVNSESWRLEKEIWEKKWKLKDITIYWNSYRVIADFLSILLFSKDKNKRMWEILPYAINLNHNSIKINFLVYSN